MDVLPVQPRVNAADLPIEQLAGNPNVSQRDKVDQACKQFEAVLLRQILGEARKTVISSGSEQDPTVNGIYNDMVTSHLADSISRAGTFGLAKSLESQLERQVLPPSQAGPAAVPTPVSGSARSSNPHDS
jgi:flagellar protein FlgJ